MQVEWTKNGFRISFVKRIEGKEVRIKIGDREEVVDDGGN
jgi:hypothetical protein